MTVQRIIQVGLLLAAVAVLSPQAASPDLGQSARRKIERIEQARLEPGETVILSEDEINSLLQYEYAATIPPGVRDPKVRLLDEQAVVYAYIDSAKMQQSTGGSLGLWGMLFGGERELKAVCRPVSAAGNAKVAVESIEIGGGALSGSALAWLLSAVVETNDSGPANHIALPENIRELRFEHGRAIVVSK